MMTNIEIFSSQHALHNKSVKDPRSYYYNMKREMCAYIMW